jgi:transposase
MESRHPYAERHLAKAGVARCKERGLPILEEEPQAERKGRSAAEVCTSAARKIGSSYQKEEMSVADLCRAYGISRPTAYRWINRYNEAGPEGLVDRSRRPHTCSHATLEPMENAILVLRAKHPSWGARKLKARLEMLQPELDWPAASTFGNILQRAGLTSPQKKRKRTTPCSEPFSLVTGPNQLWCMDFSAPCWRGG